MEALGNLWAAQRFYPLNRQGIPAMALFSPTRRTVLGSAAVLGVLPLHPAPAESARSDEPAPGPVAGPAPARQVALSINGTTMRLPLRPDTTLLDALRE